MAQKVICIEVGYSYTKVCEVDYKATNAKVYNRFELPTPEGVIMDGLIKPDEQFTRYLKIKIKEEKMTAKKVVFSIASSKIATREARIPYCKESKIPDIIKNNLDDYFPFDSSQYVISHSILEKEMEEPKEGERKPKGTPTGYKLLLVAAPKQLVDSYKKFASDIGLEFETTDFMVNSIYQAAKEDAPEGVQMVVKVDEKSCLVLVMKDGRIIMNRSIPYGVAEGINKDGSVDKELVATAINGIGRVVDYYTANHSREPLDQIAVTGLGADSDEFIELLQTELGITTRKLAIVARFVEKGQKKEISNQFVACIGAAVAPLYFYDDSQASESKKSSGIDMTTVAILFAILCIVASIILVLVSLFPYLDEKKKNAEYNAIISELQPVYDTYLQYKQLDTDMSYLEKLDKETINRNEQLAEFIEVLEDKMPATFILSSLNATEEGITLTCTVEKKEEAAVVIDELSKFSHFGFVDTTAVNELKTEIGEIMYTFQVDITYAPIIDENAEEEAAEAGEE